MLLTCLLVAVWEPWLPPPKVAQPPTTAEAIPLYKMEGPIVVFPRRAETLPTGIIAVQLWVSADKGTMWTLADEVDLSEQRLMFRAPKPGEYWVAIRLKYKNGVLVPELKRLFPEQRVAVASGYEPDPPPRASGVVEELDDQLNRIELDLIRKEMKNIAGAQEFTPEVAERIDRLRSRLRALRTQEQPAEGSRALAPLWMTGGSASGTTLPAIPPPPRLPAAPPPHSPGKRS